MTEKQSGLRHFHILSIFVVILCIEIILVEGVDRARFKTCSQSGFCRRNRDFAAQNNRESPYELILSSIQNTKGKYIADIVNRENGAEFVLIISQYEHGIVRVKINEKNPLSKRYEVPDVVSESATLDVATVEKGGLIFGKVKVQYSPFKLEYYSEDGDHVLSSGDRGLFNIEHLRTKVVEEILPEAFDLKLDGEEGEDAEDDEEKFAKKADKIVEESKYKKVNDDSLWEEPFQSHGDSKPKGFSFHSIIDQENFN